MTDPARQLLEDRALRDAARGLVQDDIAFIRDSVAARSLPARLADRVTGGARDIADEAAIVADENRVMLGSVVALGVAGLAAWVFREPLRAGIDGLLARLGVNANLGEPESPPDRSNPARSDNI